MRCVRKAALVGHAVLGFLAALVGVASAANPVFVDGVTNTQLTAGSSYNLRGEGGSTLTGSFFGFAATTVVCTGFQAVGTVQHNPGASATITSAKFTGCSSGGVACTSGGGASGELVAQGTPWTPNATATGGGIVVNGPGWAPSVYISTGNSGYFIVPSACAHNLGDCRVSPSGGAVWDAASDHAVHESASVSWFNVGVGQARVTNQPIHTSPTWTTCITSGVWSTAAVTVNTGSLVGFGDWVAIQ